MKLRLALVTLLVIIFASTLSNQVSIASANTVISSVLTPPVTQPVTSFAKSISGHVTFRFLGWFRGITHEDKVKDAANVKIEARNIFTNQKFITYTDSNGNYILGADAGKYLVSASYSNIPFAPGVRFVDLKNNKGNVNFQGFTK